MIFGLLLGLGIYRGAITAVQALDKVEHYTVTVGNLFIDFATAVRTGDNEETPEGEGEDTSDDADGTSPAAPEVRTPRPRANSYDRPVTARDRPAGPWRSGHAPRSTDP
ncbi:hypothetical protein AB1207_24265 [Kineococcus endophyticus]|uniref:Uncharacterized protein n=1 Tax=Kineococcus endophyticus TaxID=1181883 RepID=A0ABV3PF44_9ACTN